MYAKVMADIKEAMKNKETDKRDVLKQVIAKAQASAKEKKVDIDDGIMEAAFNKELKQLNQTLDSIKTQTTSDLYKSTLYKIDILKSYLPEKMTEVEVREFITSLFTGKEGLNMGSAMKLAKSEIGTKAEPALVAKIVKEWLNQK